MRPSRSVGLIPVIAAALVLFASRVAAHGIGTPQVLNEPAGPYLLSAWTDPDPLRADETHVVVAVINPENREIIVEGVEVAITMTSLADPAVSFVEVAGADEVNRLLFAAEFNDLVSEGRWRVDLAVTGQQGSGDGVSFEVDIEPARGRNWLWLGIGGLVIIIAGWLLTSMRDDSERPGRSSRRRRPTGG